LFLTKEAEKPADVMAPHADYASAARKAEEKCCFCCFYNHACRRFLFEMQTAKNAV